VVALRLYTTAAYKWMNDPLRDDERFKQGKACPLPVTTWYAQDGIKRLRKIRADQMESLSKTNSSSTKPSVSSAGVASAKQLQSAKASGGAILWRGMRNMKLAEDFETQGGTELAFMSTTTIMEVAVRYSLSKASLLFKIEAETFMQTGADLQWLSAFPGEAEVLYPPLTYLKPSLPLKKQTIKIVRDSEEMTFTVIELKPSMS